MLEQTLEPLAIQERDLGAGIGQAVFQLRSGSPGVQRRRDGADEHRAEERDRPFRQIAHRNGDAIALTHAQIAQNRRDVQRGPREALEADAILAMDQKSLAAKCAARRKSFSQSGRRVLPNAEPDARNLTLLYFERRAGAGEARVGVFDRNRGERGGRRHRGLSSHEYGRRGRRVERAWSAPAPTQPPHGMVTTTLPSAWRPASQAIAAPASRNGKRLDMRGRIAPFW